MNTHNKIYRLLGIETAMSLLRPGAKWEITNNEFTRWEDERPCPSIEEVFETMDKIKLFEDSINTVYTKDQLKRLGIETEKIEKAIG